MQQFSSPTSPTSPKMYQEWASFNPTEICERSRLSVLHKFPQFNATAMVSSCVRPLAASLTVGHHQEPAPSSVLENDREVLWIMEVICYGLSLRLDTNEQYEAVSACVTLYCEWLLALSPANSKTKSIPFPIRDDVNLYCRKLIEHLYNVFIPRTSPGQEASGDVISRQAMLCHRVLRTIETIAQDKNNLMERQTWDSLLMFLMAVNDTLLAPPVDSSDISQLCERVVSVLFEIWLIACCRCFPSPSFWKTFQQLTCTWRHRQQVIDQWNRINLMLTQRLVHAILPSLTVFNALTPKQSHLKQFLDEMSEETLKQSWFRFLHTNGNPVDLCHPEIISKTDKFYHSACASENVVDPRQHPCLNQLPKIFYKSMRGLSLIIDTFLGIPVSLEDIDTDIGKSTSSLTPTTKDTEPSTPPLRPKNVFPITINKGQSKNSTITKAATAQPQKSEAISILQPILPTMSFPSSPDYNMSSSRPKSTSILDIFGEWLFQAALFGLESTDTNDNEMIRSASATSFTQLMDSVVLRKNSGHSDRITFDSISILCTESFEAGQAEAIGALCRLFCLKRDDEEISKMLNKQSHPAFQKVKQYLTLFHLALQYGLSTKEPLRRQILASILINSTKIFQVDLPGASLLIPHFLRAMEIYLIPREKYAHKTEIEIRRACIKILLSLLSYPYHFDDLPIKDTLTETPSTTFQSLKPRLINLLIQSLTGEPDSVNIQMILGGFLLLIQNATIFDANNLNEDNNSEPSISNSMTNESLRTESPLSTSLQFMSQHDPSCDSSLASADVMSLDDGKGIPDTAKGLFGRSLTLICQILMKCREKTSYDSHVWLCALEVLSDFGRIHLKTAPKNLYPPLCFAECKETTRQICNFIECQCEKPAPFHSKDMHSTIVAAYQCLAVWFQEHPHLLKDRECISMLLEVIELGISGSKSKKNGYILKAEKQPKPASMRVREAAEALLTLVMGHFGSFPSSTSPETIVGSSLLDETILIRHMSIGSNLAFDAACEKFKYFVADNLLLIGILDHPNDKETVSIIRSPFGKFSWSMKYQQLPRKHNLKMPPNSVPRPMPRSESSNLHSQAHFRYFPESVDKMKPTKFDLMVPTLDCIITPDLKANQENMLNVIDKIESNMKFEKQKLQKSFLPSKSLECKEPSASIEFEAARLVLTHFGFLSLEALQEAPMGQVVPSLISLDNKTSDFSNNLKILDKISSRTSDTVFIYYIRRGLTLVNEILASVKNRSLLSKQFKEFLSSLGSMVEVQKHSGWTGHISTSWTTSESPTSSDFEENNLNLDGKMRVLYWADVSHEMAFVLPSISSIEEADNFCIEGDVKSRSESQADARSICSTTSDDGSALSGHSKPASEAAESTRCSLRKKIRNLLYSIGCDVKVLVFWVESMDDQFNIPIDQLLQTTGTGVETNLSSWKDYLLIFIHPLKNGLFRITFQGSAGRFPLVMPLIDGMVVSRHVLGVFIRQTALNVFRRRRLDAESFQPPHVKRRLKIQEIVNKFQMQLSECEFYNSLFGLK